MPSRRGSRRARAAALTVLAPPLLVSCALTRSPTFVTTRLFDAANDRRGAVAKLAVAPFQLGPRVVEAQEEHDPRPAEFVARDVSQALAELGVEVIPPEDVRRSLGLGDASLVSIDPARAARVVHEQFGSDAVLMGVTTRYQEREGEALGVRRPASVRFTVALHWAPSGDLAWSATFDHTQKSLSSNLLVSRHYPGRGTRWLTAQEMARWGARQTAAVFPFAP